MNLHIFPFLCSFLLASVFVFSFFCFLFNYLLISSAIFVGLFFCFYISSVLFLIDSRAPLLVCGEGGEGGGEGVMF